MTILVLLMLTFTRLVIRTSRTDGSVSRIIQSLYYAPSADRGRSIIRVNGSAKKFVRITSGFGGGEGIRTTRHTANSPPRLKNYFQLAPLVKCGRLLSFS
jgi:hypothetical protein